jgi:hypothetical protein
MALAFESVDDVHSGDSFSAPKLGVRHSVTKDILQENLQASSGLLVRELGDAMDASTASKTADGRSRETVF